jgi:hypothetical protein
VVGAEEWALVVRAARAVGRSRASVRCATGP